MVRPRILLFGRGGAIGAFPTALRHDARPGGTLDALAGGWFLATWIPFELASLLFARTTYLYYMLVVTPGLYLGAAYLVARVRLPRLLTPFWILTVVAATVVMYPLTPIPL